MSHLGLVGSEIPLQEAFDSALVDLDGVTYRGPEAIPSAPPALAAAREAGMNLMYVTNNANREPETVAAHLSDVGIPATTSEILTAAQAAAAMLSERLDAGARVLVVGGAGLRSAVSAVGLAVVNSADDAPVAVVQGYAPEIGWLELAEATYAVRAGAYFLASNMDMTLPTARGFAPGNGSLVGVVVAATGVVPDSAGKPEPAMFHIAAQRASSDRPLVIGDRLDTDLAGARAAGYPGLMVLTGVNDARDAILAVPLERPSFIGETLDVLAQPHPAPTEREGWWHVRGASSRTVDGHLEFSGSAGIDRVRAACAAAWAAADAGVTLTIESSIELGLS